MTSTTTTQLRRDVVMAQLVAITVVTFTAFAQERVDLSEYLSVQPQGVTMPEPVKPPELPKKIAFAEAKFKGMNPNIDEQRKLIKSGTRPDHPARVAAQHRAKGGA